ncbi:MAG: hypothetical protein WBP42_02625 [Candidatus Zixiibacteriota bacterium]
MTLNKGVNVREGESVAAITGRGARVTGLLGTFQKGPVNKPVYCGTLAEAQAMFGDDAVAGTTSYFDMVDMYSNGGSMQAAIVNVKGPAAAQALRTYNDIDASPQPTLTVKAKAYGAYGNSLSVVIANDSRMATRLVAQASSTAISATLQSVAQLEVGSVLKFDNGTQTEKVVLTTVTPSSSGDGTGAVGWVGGLTNTYTTALTTVSSVEFQIIVYRGVIEIARIKGLSKNPDVTFYHTKLVNIDEKNYPIETVNVVSPSTPLYDQWPAESLTPLLLTGGDDDVDGLESADWIGSAVNGTGIYAFESVEGLFRVAVPNPKINTSPADGYETVLRALLAYAKTKTASAKGFEVYAEVPFGTAVADAITWAKKFEGRELSVWYDWQTGLVKGATVVSPIIGAILGAAARKDSQDGIYASVGNHDITLRGTPYYKYSEANDQLMSANNINTITPNGARTWGAYTLAANPLWRFLNHSEQFNDIAQTLKVETGDITFKPINDRTKSMLQRRLDNYFRSKLADGEITMYTIVISQLGANTLRVNLSIGLVGVAEIIDYVMNFSNTGFVDASVGGAA